MANPEHVAKLKEGVEAWNEWRRRSGERFPDVAELNLSGAHLAELDLRGANLFRTNLSSATLDGSSLSTAYLRGANLEGATLVRAKLTRADLTDATLADSQLRAANLDGASLERANLRRADLTIAHLKAAFLLKTDLQRATLTGATLDAASLIGTNLSGANLRGARLHGTSIIRAALVDTDLRRASLGLTVLSDLDLSRVDGLHRILHTAPSTVGLDTIQKSTGAIPDIFLRGTGLSNELIGYLRSLVRSPIEFFSCFVSYSHEDKSFARRMHNQLQGEGIRCWLDEHQMRPGDDIYSQVDRGIRLWDKVLLCCSKESLTSWWVDNEIATAFEKEQKLEKERGKKVLAVIPLDLDGFLFSDECTTPMRGQLRRRLAADFKGWETSNETFEKAFEGVVAALRADDGAREEAPEGRL